MKIRVFIADDHVLVRKGLRQVLEESDNIEVVGEAADYTGLAAGVKQTWRHVICHKRRINLKSIAALCFTMALLVSIC